MTTSWATSSRRRVTRPVSAALAAVALAAVVTACASTQKPGALTQAEGIYATLQGAHADQRVEGDMIRTRATLDTAQTAVTQGQPQDYTDGIADIALRTAQTAEAHYARALALQAADSLQKLRLSRQLAISQAARPRSKRSKRRSSARTRPPMPGSIPCARRGGGRRSGARGCGLDASIARRHHASA